MLHTSGLADRSLTDATVLRLSPFPVGASPPPRKSYDTAKAMAESTLLGDIPGQLLWLGGAGAEEAAFLRETFNLVNGPWLALRQVSQVWQYSAGDRLGAALDVSVRAQRTTVPPLPRFTHTLPQSTEPPAPLTRISRVAVCPQDAEWGPDEPKSTNDCAHSNLNFDKWTTTSCDRQWPVIVKFDVRPITRVGDHAYLLRPLHALVSHSEALADAYGQYYAGARGRLVRVASAAEDAAVIGILAGRNTQQVTFWGSATDQATEGTWTWEANDPADSIPVV